MTRPDATAFSEPDLRAGVAAALRDVALTGAHPDPAALAESHWQLAVEMGWTQALVPETGGGLGLGADFIADLCEEAGRALFCGPLIETAVLLPAIAAQAAGLEPLLAGLATGAVRIGLAEGDAAGPVLAQHAATASHVAILSDSDQSLGIVLAPIGAFAVERCSPLDPGCPVARVVLADGAAATRLVLTGTAAEQVRARHQIAVAADLLGVGEAALARTVAHVLDRRQFGQQIGRFQAVKHRLADVHTALGGARLAVAHAARSGATAADARIARVLAADAALCATAAAIQLHGGLGFSWEMDLHLYLKRARRLNAQGGGTQALRAAAGDRIIAEALESLA